MDILTDINRLRLLPVVVIDDAAAAAPLANALVDGGLPIAEVTFRTRAAPKAIRALATDGRVLVGAGTVFTNTQVDEAVDAGAQFIVSPGFSKAVVDRCVKRGVVPLPGVATATEIQAVLETGFNTMKLFPAENCGGIPAIKALAGPFGHVQFVPTGGIGPNNLTDYLALPSVTAVGGSWMVPREAIASGRFEEIAGLVAESVALVS